MDWMYNDGVQIQKEDYLLGKKVDNKLIPNTDKDAILPPQICPSDTNFTQVDMTKKILEDPLVKIKMRVLESTKKFNENPMRLKKQQNKKPEKQSIEDHQLDIILVSRLKSYEKAGLDLAKILSITKHKVKKERKIKDETSSDDNEKNDNYEKSYNKQNIHEHKLTQGNRKQRDKKSFEYRDRRRNENKNKSERHRSVSSSDESESFKKTKSTNEYKHQRNDNQKYTNIHSKLKHRSVSSDKDNDHQNNKKKTNDQRRSACEEKYVHPSYKNSKNKVHRNNDVDTKKYSDSLKTDKTTKYKHQEMKIREKGHNDNKRHRSISSDREQVRKKQNYTSEYSKNKSRNIEQYHRSNSSDKEHKSKHLVDSRNKHGHYTNKNNQRSRSSESPQKIKKDKRRDKSSSASSSDDEPKKKSTVKDKQHSPELKKDNEKDNHRYKINSYGLFIPKGHSVKKVSSSPPPVKTKTNASDIKPKLPPVKKKKLTDEEMERLRNEMIADAKIRDKDRSSNVKRYRKDDKKEEEQQKPYSKDFLIKQMAHAASQVSVERSIKSNANKLQKDNSIVD